jgi:membrane-associated protein
MVYGKLINPRVSMIFDVNEIEGLSSIIIYVLCTAVVFCETGLFFGVIFPGDSLLLYLGLLASTGKINFFLILFLLIFSSFLGYLFGYWQGMRLKDWLHNKPDGMFFRQNRLAKVKAIFNKYGAVSILIAKCIPVARSFSPYVAGIIEMRFSYFVFFNFLGSVIWVTGFLSLGYFLGNEYADVMHKLLPWLALFIVSVFVFTFLTYYIKNKKRK